MARMEKISPVLVELVVVNGISTINCRPSAQSRDSRQLPTANSCCDVAPGAPTALAGTATARVSLPVPEPPDPARRSCPTNTLRSYALRKSELLSQQFHPAMKVDAH